MSAKDDLIWMWRYKSQEDRERIIYLLKLARMRDAQKKLDEQRAESEGE